MRNGGEGSGASVREGEGDLQLRLHRLQGHRWSGPWHTAVKQGTRARATPCHIFSYTCSLLSPCSSDALGHRLVQFQGTLASLTAQ